MDSRFWGPHAWAFLHSIAESFPIRPTESEKEGYRVFMKSLPKILPCMHCRESLAVYITQIPMEPYLVDRDHFSWWVWTIHRRVNEKLERQYRIKVEGAEYWAVRAKYGKYVKRKAPKRRVTPAGSSLFV